MMPDRRKTNPLAERSASVLPVVLAALALGTSAAIFYALRDLTLSHYDAKAHLVVARRIFDSLWPGWMQIGAVWLPLPHLLNCLPVQVDWLYRTGLSGVAWSVAGYTAGAVALWWLVERATGRRSAAWAAFAVFATQPDLLYLQATPMTEGLLVGLSLAGVALTWRWVASKASGPAWPASLVLALACLTRYEAWFITLGAFALSGVALARLGLSLRSLAVRLASLAIGPAMAVLAFLVLSRLTVGSWLVTGGFFEVDPASLHRPLVALTFVGYGVRLLNGWVTVVIAGLALAALAWHVVRRREASHLVVVLALAACALLPAWAFFDGHPFRIRYMVPLSMALAAVTGLGVGLLRTPRLAAAVVVAVALVETPPFSSRSPMVVEAQWDRPSSLLRRQVTAYLEQHYDGRPILASMGSLAHYMHETSAIGLSIRDYIHEGTGRFWMESLVAARRHAGWVLIEEQAEGGDELARLRKASPAFLDGFERVSEGGGVALYRLRRLQSHEP